METDSLIVFSKRLREAIGNEKGVQKQLAEGIGCSEGLVSGWLRGQNLPSPDLLIRIHRHLGVSIDWLLGLETEDEVEYEHAGIRWSEHIPKFLTKERKQEVELGIRLFREFVEQNRSSESLKRLEVFASYDLDILYWAFKTAIRSGCLRLTHVPTDPDRETNLKKRFPHLRKVCVASLADNYDGTPIRAEFVAFLAARQIFPSMITSSAIGVGIGYTLLRMAELSFPSVNQFRGAKWIPLVAFADGQTSPISANHIVKILASNHALSEAVYLPYVDSSSSEREKSAYKRVLDEIQINANTIFMTVNGAGRRPRARTEPTPKAQFRSADYTRLGNLRRTYDDLAERGLSKKIGGEMLGVFVSHEGEILGVEGAPDEYRESALSRSFQLVKDIAKSGDVYIVAARQYKAQAVKTALGNRLANSLIIDSEIADYLIG